MFVPAAHPRELHEAVRALLGSGLSDREIAARTGVGRATVQRWRLRGFPRPVPDCPIRISPSRWPESKRETYAYLLGLYLGDGYVGTNERTFSLVIACDAHYPDLLDLAHNTVAEFCPRSPGRHFVKGTQGVRVVSYWKAWPLLFPQHGPGSKLDRKIELAAWQQEIVDEYPNAFVRGLIHSDGSRCLNTFTVELKDGPKEYSYPRYFFTNYSADIQRIFCDARNRLGIRWSRSNWRNISISHRRSVARLDGFVGPKS